MTMFDTVASIDTSCRLGFPSWKLEAAGDGTVQHIDRTTPNMEIMELGAWPGLATEQFKGAATRVIVGNAVHDVNSMKNSMKNGQGPQFSIGDIWPMDGAVM